MNHQRLNRQFKEALRLEAHNRRVMHESFMAEGGYTEAFITQSAAGYYLGTWYRDTEFGGYWSPGSRDSGYYATLAEAKAAFPWAESDFKTVLERAGTEYAAKWGCFMPRKWRHGPEARKLSQMKAAAERDYYQRGEEFVCMDEYEEAA